MKKIFVFFIALSLALLLVSCSTIRDDNSSTSDINTNSSEETTGDINTNSSEETTADTVMGDDPVDADYLLSTAILQTSEDQSIFKPLEFASFKTVEYTDTAAKQTLQLEIDGIKHSFLYENSASLAMADIDVDVYKLKDSQNSKVFINKTDGSVVKYVNIPLNSKLQTESDYNEFIRNILPDNLDFANYNYRCTTHYYAISELGVESSVEEGFRSCSESERLGSYSFYYDRSIQNIKTSEHISAEFRQNNFTLEIYDLSFDKEFEKLFSVSDKLESQIAAHIASNMSEIKLFKELSVDSMTLFVKDGTPYILVNSTIKFCSKENSGVVLTAAVQTVSCIKN